MDVRLAVGRLSWTVTLDATPRAVPEEQRSYFQRVDVAKREATKERLLSPIETRRVYPDYTLALRDDGLRGTVHLQGIVDAAGNVTRVRTVSTPDERLSALVLDAVQKWQFEPTRLSGVPVPVTVVFVFHFQ